MMNELRPKLKRTGFYPASAHDYLEPLQLLKGWVDHLIFCDLNKAPQNSRQINEIRNSILEQSLPEASFLLGDALSALDLLKPVDVFFVRNDSCGEGGSALALLHADRIRLVLNLIKPGGFLVTDKSNGYLWIVRMLSGKSPNYPVGDRVLSLANAQPWLAQGLYMVNVT